MRDSGRGTFVAKDEIGNRYGRLVVIEKAPTKGAAIWVCKCDCGNSKTLRANNLRKGHVKSCGCLQKELASTRQSKPGLTSLWNSTISSYRHGAGKRNHEWGLEREYAISLMESACHYCGDAPLNIRRDPRGKELKYNGLDRVDNTLGYIKDNVVACCKICNMAKRQMSKDDFIAWVKRVAARH